VNNLDNHALLTLRLLGVNNGTATNDVSVPMACSLATRTGTASVNASDVSQVKAQIGLRHGSISAPT